MELCCCRGVPDEAQEEGAWEVVLPPTEHRDTRNGLPRPLLPQPTGAEDPQR